MADVQKFPIEIDCKIKQAGKTKRIKFKILNCFYAIDRSDELDTVPKTPSNMNDYWLVSKMLCEKDGGRLPSEDELTILSGLIEREIIDLPYGAYWSSVEVSSSQARRRFISSNLSYFGTSDRSYSYYKALCVGGLN